MVIDILTELGLSYDSERGSGDQGVIDAGRFTLSKATTRKKAYYKRDIVIYEEGRYRMINGLVMDCEIMLNNLPPDKRQSF